MQATKSGNNSQSLASTGTSKGQPNSCSTLNSNTLEGSSGTADKAFPHSVSAGSGSTPLVAGMPATGSSTPGSSTAGDSKGASAAKNSSRKISDSKNSSSSGGVSVNSGRSAVRKESEPIRSDTAIQAKAGQSKISVGAGEEQTRSRRGDEKSSGIKSVAVKSSERDTTSRFLQYLRDWEEKFAKQEGQITSGSEIGMPGFSVPGFDPNCAELQTAWWTASEMNEGSAVSSTRSVRPIICCLNTYPNGITFSVHQNSGPSGSGIGGIPGNSSPRTRVGPAFPEPSFSTPGQRVHFPLDSESDYPVLRKSAEAAKRPHRTSLKNAAPAEGSIGDQGTFFHDEESVTESGLEERKYLPDQFHLRFRDNRDLRTPAGRYHLHRENVARVLAQHLAQLHRAGKLNDTVLYFGTMTDPFLSLHKKFDVTMSCLDVIERYAPGRVIFQTRSPMVISVLPALKKLGARAAVAISVETNSEKAVARYTPGMPRIAERLVAADGLRKQGIIVNLQVSPVLPYGDFVRDAWDFAELLDRHSDYVTFGSLSTGNPAEERFLRTMPIAQKLSADGMYAWLRPHAYQAVFHAMSVLAKEKLLLPAMSTSAPKQLKLFAA